MVDPASPCCAMQAPRVTEEIAMRLPSLIAAVALALAVPLPVMALTVPTPAMAPVSEGVELIMVDQPGCIYCATWKKEVMPQYALTPEGKAAPLRIVPKDGPWPDGVALDSKPAITPTFILLRGGKEEARLEGYPGEHFFWPLLDQMLRRADVSLEQED